MKSFIVSAALLLGAAAAQAQTWKVDASHSKVGFAVDYMVVSQTEGQFKKYDLTVEAKSDDFVGAKINFSADAASVNTEDEKRDGHLKGEEFFYVEKFPKITFVGTDFKKVKGNEYTVTGDLTMRGVTKRVTFPATFGGVKKDPWGNLKAGFVVSGKINRKDYGINWNKGLDAGGVVVSDDVNLNIKLTLIKS